MGYVEKSGPKTSISILMQIRSDEVYLMRTEGNYEANVLFFQLFR